MISEIVGDFSYKKIRNEKDIFSKAGRLSIGLSFSAWVIISVAMAIHLVLPYSLSIYLLSVSSFCLTSIGLAAIALSSSTLRSPAKYVIISSLGVFISLNIIGFFSLDSASGSITWVVLYSMIEQSAVFILFLIIFGLTLFPFLRKKIKWMILVPYAFACIYLGMLIKQNLSIYSIQSIGIATPVDIVSPLGQLFSPVFGLPGNLFSYGFVNVVPAYALLLAALANSGFASLYFYSLRETH